MLDDFEDASLGFEGLFCTNKGEEVNQDLVKRVLDIVVGGKLSLFKKDGYNSCNELDTYTNAKQLFRRVLDLKMESDVELRKNKSLVYAIFEWFLRYETIENGCDSMDEVSTASYTNWTNSGDGTLLNFKHGYRSLIHWFRNQMPSKRWIHLNKEVRNIELLNKSTSIPENVWYNENNDYFDRPVLIRYLDKSKIVDSFKSDNSYHEEGIIECDHVIVTTSLGVLKKNHETLFKPPLPWIKIDLINSIGFGTVNKIILQFESPFWNDDHGIKLIWAEDEDDTIWPRWVYDILAFDVVRRQPNLLIGWIGGEGSKVMENESDKSVGETCLRILKRFLPSNYNEPTKLVSCLC